jgi:signal transduction histidine kinase
VTSLASALLGSLIFAIDTFTEIESAIAVFYVIVVILAAGILSRVGIVMTSSACACLSVLSYFVSHGIGDDPPTLLRLAGALSALAIATALLLRNDMVESDLLASHEQTRKSELRYRSIFEQSRVALWEQDFSALKAFLDGLKEDGVRDLTEYARNVPDFAFECTELIRTTDLNKAALELLGADTLDQASGTISRFIRHEDPCFTSLMVTLFEGRRRFESKGRIKDVNGNDTNILVALEFPETDVAFDRVVVGLIDITQRETTQAALMAAQSELARASRVTTVGALSASIAHELNQPLAALVMNAEASLRWLGRDPPDVESAISAVERLMRDGHRTSEIIKTTRALLARKPSVADSIEIASLVNETRLLMSFELARNGIEFEFVSDSNTPRIAAAKTELQQVLINLLTNAMQAMSHTQAGDRKVTISAAPAADGFVRILVKDSGPGIETKDIEKLFVPFYTTKPHGVGIGLAICRSTIEARGGQINATSHADGAMCEILLPADPTELASMVHRATDLSSADQPVIEPQKTARSLMDVMSTEA